MSGVRHQVVPAGSLLVVDKLTMLSNTGKATPLPETVTVECRRLSSLIRVTVTYHPLCIIIRRHKIALSLDRLFCLASYCLQRQKQNY